MTATGRRSRTAWALCTLAIAATLFLGLPAGRAAAQGQPLVAVLADPADPYYPLAEEIAAAEGTVVYHSLAAVLASQPEFLLWVVSPNFLSDEVMVAFGLETRESGQYISTGIITASTLAGARALWQRRTQVQNTQLYAASAANTSAHIPSGVLRTYTAEGTVSSPLTMASFQEALAAADYLTFTGHGSNWFLGLDEQTRITSKGVPALDGLVISTGSCQTMRPWEENAISLKFIDQGAAAYSGFVYSPNEGYLMGEFGGLPMRYTWPDFPIGHVIQAQNRGTLQGFALFPFHYLLGDPRIALQDGPPYEVLDDREEGAWRTITYANVPPGVVPIRVPGGAAYAFVQADGISAAAEGDPFYNSLLQWANIGTEKYILLEQPGGTLTLRLRRQAPWYWFPSDILADSFDHTLIYIQENDGDLIMAVFAGLVLLWAGWMGLRKRLAGQNVRTALVFGLGAALLQLGYAALRLGKVTVTSKPAAFSTLSIANAFVLAFCAALIFLQARRAGGKAMALAVVSAQSWVPAVFSLLLLWFYNQFGFRPQLGAALYNYALGLLPLASLVFTVAVAGVALDVLANRRR